VPVILSSSNREALLIAQVLLGVGGAFALYWYKAGQANGYARAVADRGTA
jgi:hypothetical protein